MELFRDMHMPVRRKLKTTRFVATREIRVREVVPTICLAYDLASRPPYSYRQDRGYYQGPSWLGPFEFTVRAIPELRGTVGERLRFLLKIRTAFEAAAKEVNAPLWAFTQLLRPRHDIDLIREDIRPRDQRLNGEDAFPRTYLRYEQAAVLSEAWIRSRVEAVAAGLLHELPQLPVAMERIRPSLFLSAGQGVPFGKITQGDLAIIAEALRRTTERVPGLVLWVKGVGESHGLLRMRAGIVEHSDLELLEPVYQNPYSDNSELVNGKRMPNWDTLIENDPTQFIRTKAWIASQKNPMTAAGLPDPIPSLGVRFLRWVFRWRPTKPGAVVVDDLGLLLPGGTPMAARVAAQMALEDRTVSYEPGIWFQQEDTVLLCL